MPESNKSASEMLAESLKVRYFHDDVKFRERYGDEIHNMFGGMIPIVDHYLKWLDKLESED